MVCEKDWVDYISALLLPSIAIVAMLIAWLQWDTNKRRLRHELFDRRYRVFEAAQKFIVTALRDLTIEQKDLSVFYAEKLGATFIFDEEIDNYLNTMYKKATQLRVANKTDNDKELQKLSDWFEEQGRTLEDVFRKHISV